MRSPIDKMYEDKPLMKFSPQTQVQVDTLFVTGEIVLGYIDAAMSTGDSVNAKKLSDAYGLLWLWVLGVYEVLRTMDQRKACFSEELSSRITSEKRYLAMLRMPIAKQEFANRGGNAQSEGLLSGISVNERDVSFSIKGQLYSARDMYERFRGLFMSIQANDIRTEVVSVRARSS